MLGLLGGVVLVGTVGCGGSDEQGPATQPTTSTTAPAPAPAPVAATGEIPDETAGPFPGDGSNGPNSLTQSGIVRSDIRSSFGSASGTAQGVPLTIELTVSNDGAPYKGAAVYLWHCDRDGKYSMYSEGITGENYLRGIQEADANGLVRFTSIFPAAYSGRWPHIHFEVYGSLDKATSASKSDKTSQLAFPEAVCTTVYASAGYEQSADNLARSPLETDNVFRDGHSSQLATVTGDLSNGYTAKLPIPL